MVATVFLKEQWIIVGLKKKLSKQRNLLYEKLNSMRHFLSFFSWIVHTLLRK